MDQYNVQVLYFTLLFVNFIRIEITKYIIIESDLCTILQLRILLRNKIKYVVPDLYSRETQNTSQRMIFQRRNVE